MWNSTLNNRVWFCWLVHWLAKSESEDDADDNTAIGWFSGFGYSVECWCRLHTAFKIWWLRLQRRVVGFIGYSFDRSVLWSSVPRQQGFMALTQTGSSSLRFSGFTSSSPFTSTVSHSQHFLMPFFIFYSLFCNCLITQKLWWLLVFRFCYELGSNSAKIKEKKRVWFNIFCGSPKLSFLVCWILI